MMSRATAVRADGQSAADDLAQAGQVGRDAEALLGAAARDAETGDDLVEDQQRAVARASSRAGARGSPAPGGTTPMLPATGSTMTAAMSLGVCFERGADGGQVVVRDRQRLRGGGRGHAGRVGLAERQRPRAGLDQQAVGVAVVAAVELEDHVAAGMGRARGAARSSSPRCRS